MSDRKLTRTDNRQRQPQAARTECMKYPVDLGDRLLAPQTGTAATRNNHCMNPVRNAFFP